MTRLAAVLVALLWLGSAALGAGCTLPPDVSTRVGRGQTFSSAWTPAQYTSANLAQRDYYWGQNGDANNDPVILNRSKFFSSSYSTISRILFYKGVPGNVPGQPGYPLWKLTLDHPDWLMYLADKATLPDDFGDPAAAVDITNPAVQAWKETNEAAPIMAGGFQGISMDNSTPQNDYGYVGAWKTNPVTTTNSGIVNAGGTSVQLTSTAGFANGQQVIIQDAGYFRTQTISPANAGATAIIVDDVSNVANSATVTIPGGGAAGGLYTGTVTSFSVAPGAQYGTINISPALSTAVGASSTTVTVQTHGVYVGTEVGAPSGASITVTPAISAAIGLGKTVKTAQWAGLYTGSVTDNQFAVDRAAWLTTLTAYVHSLNGCVSANVTYIPTDATHSANIANAVDIVYDEDGVNGNTIPSACSAFQGSGTGAAWVAKLNYMLGLKSSIAYVLENSMCPPGTMNRQVVEAAVGTMLLIKNSHTYLEWFFSNGTIGSPSNFPDLDIGGQWPDFWWTHGAALESVQSDNLLYWRHFANGLAICNPAASAPSFDFGTTQYHSFDNLPYPPVPASTTVVPIQGPGCYVLKSGPAAFGQLLYPAK